MNELQKYIIQKGIEKGSIDFIKNIIFNDDSLSIGEKERLIGILNAYSLAKDMTDVIKFLMNRKD